MFTMGNILDIAVQLEENGERTYRRASQTVSELAVAGLLSTLADDEAAHRAWFEGQRQKLESADTANGELETMGRRLLRNVLKNQIFSLEDADFSTVDKMEDVLTIAMEFEEDTVLFYEMIGSFISDESTLEGLEGIIAEERKHIRLLKTQLDALPA